MVIPNGLHLCETCIYVRESVAVIPDLAANAAA